jgi:predicted acylesterase/phospholipase RssA
MPTERKTVRLLSIDGGGIRGLIPAVILAGMQKMLGSTPLVDLFDVVSGTSTGGLIALGLTVPGANGKPMYTADDMVQLYTQDGSRIFSRSFWYRLCSLRGWIRPKWPTTGIDAVLAEKFQSVELKDALKEVVITSYGLQHRQVRLFTRTLARLHARDNFYMRDVARATSAAPTYFAPAEIHDIGSNSRMIMVDGGVGANNPCLAALVETMKMFPGKDVFMVSIGTGKGARPFPPRQALRWGILGWAVPITDVLFDAQASLAAEEMMMLLPRKHDEHPNRFRFQPTLAQANEQMDDVSPANLAALQKDAQELLDSKKDEFKTVCERLLSTD